MSTDVQPPTATPKQQQHALNNYEKYRSKDPLGNCCVICMHPFGISNRLEKEPHAHHYHRRCPQCGFKNVL